MILYLAGPMTTIPQFNYPAFYEASHTLQLAGYSVINPPDMDTSEVQEAAWASETGNPLDLPDDFDLHDTVRKNIEGVLLADGLVLLPGWEQSKGAQMELSVAERIGLYVGDIGWYTDNADALLYLNRNILIEHPFLNGEI